MRLVALLALVTAGALAGGTGASAAPLIAEYGDTSIPTDAKPTDVVVGPDGNQWYTFPGRDAIARVTPSGAVQEITAGISSGAAPQSIAVGPDDNLWFTEPGRDRIARYSFATGTVTEFGTGIPSGARPWDIVDAGGALWFTENGTGQIGRSSTSGSIAQLSPPVPAGAQVWGIAADDNGFLWFPYSTATEAAVMSIDQDGDEVCTTGPVAARYIVIGDDGAAYVGDTQFKGIDRISPDCQTISVFTASQQIDVSGLALGPDNNIWFTDTAVPSVGRAQVSAGSSGDIDLFTEGLYDGSLPTGIAAEPLSETLWIGDVGPNSFVGKVSTFGGIAQFGFGTLADGAAPQQIGLGNGWMYFTETGASRVGAISFEPSPPSAIPEGMIVDTSSGISSGSEPYGVVWDGATGLWITQQDGRIAHSDGIDFLALSPFSETSSGITAGSEPWDITMAENAPWFTERSGGRYALVDPTLPNFSVQEEIPLPAGSEPEGIAESGGFLWIADPAGERVFQQTNTGVDTIPTTGYGPSDLAAGPDGNLWFTAPAENAVGRVTPQGGVTIFQAGISPNAQPTGITAGPGDGALWFTEPGLDQIGRIVPPAGSSTTAHVSEFGGLTAGSDPTGVAADDEGSVWFTETGGDRIGRALLGPPQLDPAPSSLVFPDTPIDGQSERTLTIENGGDLPLAIASLSIFPSGMDEFAIPAATDECSDTVLPVGDSCTVVVAFTPAAIGPSGNAWLRAPSNSPLSPALIPLSGEGIAAALFSVSPSSGAFGDVPVGQTAGPEAFTVTNLGDETFDVGTPAVQGPGAAAFAVGTGADDCAGQTLSHAESCQVRVTFTPAAAGTVSATLSFDDDAPGGPHTLALSGSGVIPGFSVQPSSASFGVVVAGTSSAPRTFTVANPGGAPLTLGSLALTGEDPEDFRLVDDGCSGQTLTPGSGSCSFGVSFVPTAVGTPAALVSFGDNAPGGPHVLPVSGTGGAAPLPPPPPPVEAPALTRLELTPVAFTPFRRGGSFAARTGSVLSFRLSQPATVTFSVRRYRPGRRSGRRCLPTRAEVPRRQRCRALVAVGRPFARSGLPAGARRLTFTGRPNGRALAAGDYRLYATPRNAGGTGATKSVAFELKRRRARAGAARAQDPPDAALQAVVDGLVEDAFVGAGLSGALQVFDVPGSVLTVDAPGRPARTFTAGLADLRGGGIPMRADRPQPVGSGTKPMTAVLVLGLVERGRIGLDEQLARAAARHRRDGGRLARLTRRYRHRLRGVTVRQLLNMTSGLQDYMNGPAFARAFARSPRARHSMPRLAAWGLAERPLFRPGAPGRTYYSNTNYVLLGMLVEAVTGRSYASRLRSLFRRAGMRSSSYPTGLLPAAVTRGYGPPLPGGPLPSPLRQLRTGFAPAPRVSARTDPTRVWIVSSNPLVEGPTVPLSPAGPADEARYGGVAQTTWQDVTRAYNLSGVGSAAGAAVSTAQDLARFWEALWRGRLLRPRTLRMLRQSAPAPPNAPGVRNYYGLGVQRQDVGPGAFWPGSPRLRVWMKLGDVFGYTSASYYLEGPPRYDGLVVTNTTNLFPIPVGDLGLLRDTLRAMAPRQAR